MRLALRLAAVVLVSVATLFPLAWMAIAGFKSRTEVLRTPLQFFPETWHVDNYAQIAQDPVFLRALTLTFVGAAAFTVLSLAVNSLAGYAFARLDFSLKRFFWAFCILPLFIPSFAILITSFVVVAKLGMLDSLAVLIIPGAASAFQMFFLRQFYLSVPTALEEAAMIDGASRWQIFTRIFLPMSRVPFVVVGFISFVAYWNSYVWPVLTIQNPDLFQIQQYLATFRSERGNEWGLLMAGSFLSTLPLMALVLIFQRHIVNGLRISGLR